MKRAAGFTLIELVVALTIVALALAVVPVSMMRLHDNLQYRSAVRDVLSGLRSAQVEALRTGHSVPFTLDTAERRYWIGDGRSGSLPDSLELGLIVAQQELFGEAGSIRFHPDGGSTGGSIILQRASGDGVRLRVDWLLGRVSQEPLT